MKTVLIVNLEVKDNHEEAAVGARLTFDLCQEVWLSCNTYFLCIHSMSTLFVDSFFMLWFGDDSFSNVMYPYFIAYYEYILCIDWSCWIMGGDNWWHYCWFWETAPAEAFVQHLLLLKISQFPLENVTPIEFFKRFWLTVATYHFFEFDM